MTTEFEFLKLERCVLKVNMHCLGCVQKVRKLLRKLEGVYTVTIDAEQQLVLIIGSVDSATLIKKLVESGKYAELHSPSPNQLEFGMNRYQMENNQTLSLNNGPTASRAQHDFPTSFCGEEEREWGSELFQSQHTGREAITGQYDKNFISATVEENMLMGSDGIGGGFLGFGSHEYGAFQELNAWPSVIKDDDLPPLINTNMQAYYNSDSLN
ncbi:heavy metal-associated isoprenylated plant protein 8-like isoform X2 [Humulus lupulus]|uniref:heavy metal-associated isoprenylated plant protein 8-like isoform X2 n=1 Tax=Humulus lupulus TaxID=3486 RepID=UPI002B407E7A|nr:heavy metal-associated isoprenylated plant protein 8-like isoform X2 [Humulus lupulus]